MSIGLLDVNALIALLWEEHPFHPACARWFNDPRRAGWATCLITELGFARILSSPAFTANPPSVHAALQLIDISTRSSKSHDFWSDDIQLFELSNRWRKLGSKQITDAYLLSLAMHHKGKLVTFDRRMLALAPEGSEAREALEILG